VYWYSKWYSQLRTINNCKAVVLRSRMAEQYSVTVKVINFKFMGLDHKLQFIPLFNVDLCARYLIEVTV
jgi:hypothetical protein